jgi:hypothetical protein
MVMAPVDQDGRFQFPEVGWSTGNVRRNSDPNGLVTRGNIDLEARTAIRHEGKVFTLRPITFQQGNQTVLIPSVVGDRVVGQAEAIANYKQTGEHLGVFETQAHADAYAKQLTATQDENFKGGRARGDYLPGVPRSVNIEDRRKDQTRMKQGPSGQW